MGGEKFDTPHPEGYLFGENMDLNFLGNRPVQVGLVGAGPVGGMARPPAASGHQAFPPTGQRCRQDVRVRPGPPEAAETQSLI